MIFDLVPGELYELVSSNSRRGIGLLFFLPS
jgi:hypothetical protein